ncbi:RDD family protein [Actinoplanes sp. NPDC049265]|uniref:RDD family protein n=1 Tax=Actinoplanes sp. NPDC049265 TaxID=3363902 RepID=UPI003715277B
MTYQAYPPYQGPPPYGYGGPPQPMSPGGQPLADFGNRLLAYIIDSAILGAVIMLIFLPVYGFYLYGVMNSVDATDPNPFGDVIGPFLIIYAGIFLVDLILLYLYHVEYMHRGGQTLGKKIMKLKVVPIDPNLRLTRGMAAKRYVVETICGLVVPMFSYLDGFWQLWDKPYQQTLHDKFAETVVVKVGP